MILKEDEMERKYLGIKHFKTSSRTGEELVL